MEFTLLRFVVDPSYNERNVISFRAVAIPRENRPFSSVSSLAVSVKVNVKRNYVRFR